MKKEVLDYITREIEQCESREMFREPLVGFSSVDDPLYMQLKRHVGEWHVHPRDILPSARTVISFFIPFAESISRENHGGTWPAREWAECYIACNALINDVSEKLAERFRAAGHEAEAIRATHTYSAEKLQSAWSHRSAAFIAGMGSFGLNRMLITCKGGAGRYGTVIVSAAFEADVRAEHEYCRAAQGCRVCVRSCPVGALTEHGFDKFKCNAHLLQADARYPELEKCDVCGKCVCGPCAVLEG